MYIFICSNGKYGEDPEFIKSPPYLLSWSFMHGLLLKECILACQQPLSAHSYNHNSPTTDIQGTKPSPLSPKDNIFYFVIYFKM